MGVIIGHLWLGDVDLAVVDLDDLPLYRKLDPSGMLDHLHQFPGQCRLAWEKVSKFELPREYRRVEKVVILGMGGSAIGGDMVRCLALAESRVPVWVNRDYGLPPFVDGSTLVIASSYSGNTEETLSAFTVALKTPARKLAITARGRLKKLAEKEGVPVFTIDYQAPPRAAFPHSFVPLVGIFQRLGLLGDKSADLKKALKVLDKLAGELVETTPLVANPAKRLAARLLGHLVVIYGGEVFSEVARRWKTQLNENGKAWAFFELFPELNHNAAAGYDFPPELRDKIFVVLLHSSLLSPQCQLHYKANAELLARSGIGHELMEAVGETTLAQMLSLVLLGDYVSFYLAMLNETDPTALAAVDFVKGYLARFKAGS
jgi:glucose/mannose-6-phosphate isomerase